jgi:hypothetical protein
MTHYANTGEFTPRESEVKTERTLVLTSRTQVDLGLRESPLLGTTFLPLLIVAGQSLLMKKTGNGF